MNCEVDVTYYDSKDEERNQKWPRYHAFRLFLGRRYDNSSIERWEYVKEECRGGFNFTRTLGLVLDTTDDPHITETAAHILLSIVTFPNAGSLSWEIRRFVRTAPKEAIPEFFHLIQQYIHKHHKLALDMDDYWWQGGGSTPADQEIERLRWRLKNT